VYNINKNIKGENVENKETKNELNDIEVEITEPKESILKKAINKIIYSSNKYKAKLKYSSLSERISYELMLDDRLKDNIVLYVKLAEGMGYIIKSEILPEDKEVILYEGENDEKGIRLFVSEFKRLIRNKTISYLGL
jgi:hypothetical protein